MQSDQKIRIVISGGPGTGKSTIIQALGELGYPIHEEISRKVIQEALTNHSDGVPWDNLPLFSENVAAGRQAQFHDAHEGLNFYDRSMVDTLAYLVLDNYPIPQKYTAWLDEHKYHNLVLFAPFWDEIYVQDDERKESIIKAKQISQVLKDSYLFYGYSLVELPKSSVQERILFIKDFISENEFTG